MRADDHETLARERKLRAINAPLAEHARTTRTVLFLVMILDAVLLAIVVSELLDHS